MVPDGRHLGGGVHLLRIYPVEGLAIAAEIRNPKFEIEKKVESICYAFTPWKVCNRCRNLQSEIRNCKEGGVHLLYIYPAEGLAIAAEIRNPKSEIVESI